MKNKILTILLLAICSTAYCQNNDCEKYIRECDNLKNKCDSLTNKIAEINQTYSEKNVEFQKILRENKNWKDTVSVRDGKIDELNLEINNKNLRIEKLIDSFPTEYKRGKEYSYQIIAGSYKSMSFDELIVSSSLEAVRRDINMIGDDTEAKAILCDLEKYYQSESVISKKYSKYDVDNALKKLGLITRDSKKVIELKDLLQNYEMRNEGLGILFNELVDIDANEIANNESTDKKKRGRINDKIMRYMYDYEFTLNDYPYISNIILEIINRKQADSNASLEDLNGK